MCEDVEKHVSTHARVGETATAEENIDNGEQLEGGNNKREVKRVKLQGKST